MERITVVHPFEPLVSPESRILILGSFPSVRSREQMFFYGHPQNRFWRMLAAVYGEKVPETLAEKKDLVLSHQLALWDTVAQCSITGSSDASIRDIVPVDILRIVQPAAIHTVLCNGRLSGTLYQRYLEPVTGIAAHIMPSTSPANAAFSLEKLVECWRPLLLSCSSENGI